MAQVSVAQNIHAEQTGDPASAAGGKNQGTLKAAGKELTVFLVGDSEAVTEGVDKFLQSANLQKGLPETLQEHEFTHITKALVEVEHEILELHEQLAKMETPKEEKTQEQPQLRSQSDGRPTDAKTKGQEGKQQSNTSQNGQQAQNGKSEVVYTSLFSLARSFHSSLNEATKQQKSEQKPQERTQAREEARPHLSTPSTSNMERMLQPQESRFDREGDGKQERDGQEEEKEGQNQNQDQRQQQNHQQQSKKKKVVSIGNIQAARSAQPNKGSSSTSTPQASRSDGSDGVKSARESVGSVENIYIRFMALMARILGQAELEAHQLYLKIKERTDDVDVLTLLLQKINSEKGAIDWSKNEEMKQLIEKAREIGVDIPEGKLKWSEEEKKLLKENIQMRKDSMEKITQLERTDMQRYLQEASQCHQARSNVLKLLKEVIDTIIHNMRGG